ncbi:MAG: DUF6259 domain-containing protein [Kiritimatiellia bacterium]
MFILKSRFLRSCFIAMSCVGLLHAEEIAQNRKEDAPELINQSVAVKFDETTGAITSIRNKSLDVDYTTGTPARSLFMLQYLDQTKKIPKNIWVPPGCLRNHTVKTVDGRQTLVLDYIVPCKPEGNIKVQCRAWLETEGNEIRWDITVDNQSEDVEIVEVRYPILGGLRIGPHSENNYLTWPHWGGGHLIHNPQNTGKYRHGEYPGGGAIMPWMDLYCSPENSASGKSGPTCGLYFASYDSSLLLTQLEMIPAKDRKSLTLQTSKYAHIPGGEKWASAEFVTAIHAGDWHTAADSYRSWFNSWASPPDPPGWLKQCDGRLELTMTAEPDFATQLKDKFELASTFGLDFVRFGGQMIASIIGKRRCNRFPLPDPVTGSEEEFAQAVRAIRAEGGHPAFYINGQAWDPRWPDMLPRYKGRIASDVQIPDWNAGFSKNALKRFNDKYYEQYKRALGHWPDPSIR